MWHSCKVGKLGRGAGGGRRTPSSEHDHQLGREMPENRAFPAETVIMNQQPLAWEPLTKPHGDRPVLSRTSSAVADEQLGVPELGFRHLGLPVPAGRMAALTGTDGA